MCTSFLYVGYTLFMTHWQPKITFSNIVWKCKVHTQKDCFKSKIYTPKKTDILLNYDVYLTKISYCKQGYTRILQIKRVQYTVRINLGFGISKKPCSIYKLRVEKHSACTPTNQNCT